MSVTFSIDAPTAFPSPAMPRHDDPDYHAKGEAWYEARCIVMAQREDVEGEFNVANANARYIVEALLGEEFDYCGSLDATTAAQRLSIALAMGAEDAGVVTPTDDGGVRLTLDGVGVGSRNIDCGRSAAQVSGYAGAVAHLVEIAQARGCGIQWG